MRLNCWGGGRTGMVPNNLRKTKKKKNTSIGRKTMGRIKFKRNGVARGELANSS